MENLRRSMAKNSFAYLLILPATLYIVCFQLYPIIESIVMSFTNANLLKTTRMFIGVANYEKLLFSDRHFWPIVKNSFIWIFVSLIFQMTLGMMMALALNQKLRGNGLFRGLSMVPWVMPVVVVGIMFKWIMDYYYGLLNCSLKDLGLITQSIDWFGDPNWVWTTLVLAATWKGACYPSVMILAGLKGISGDIYEAATVDGAGPVQSFWRLTLPLLRPVLFNTGLVMIITGWTKFEMIWVLTNGGPGFATSILPTYVYTNSFSFYKMGIGSAVAVIAMLILFVFIAVYYAAANREVD